MVTFRLRNDSTMTSVVAVVAERSVAFWRLASEELVQETDGVLVQSKERRDVAQPKRLPVVNEDLRIRPFLIRHKGRNEPTKANTQERQISHIKYHSNNNNNIVFSLILTV